MEVKTIEVSDGKEQYSQLFNKMQPLSSFSRSAPKIHSPQRGKQAKKETFYIRKRLRFYLF